MKSDSQLEPEVQAGIATTIGMPPTVTLPMWIDRGPYLNQQPP